MIAGNQDGALAGDALDVLEPPVEPRREGRPQDLERGGGVEVETQDGLKRFPDATREDAPRLVAELVAAGAEIYGVRVVRDTLEDVYLEAVEGESS